MRRLAILGLGAALLLGWGPAGRAEPDDGDDAPKPAVNNDTGANAWGGHLIFGSRRPAPARTPPPKRAKDKPPAKTGAATKSAPTGDDASGVRAREEAALLRRMEVCLKLKQIAERTNDAELERLAEQLDQRANDVYFHRIATLPASHAEPDLDERLLGQHDELTNAGMPLPPTATTHTVPSPDSRRAAAREEEP